MDFSSCVRERDAAPQMDLPWAERRRNVRGAFTCTRLLAGKTVAVVDDVMTTGATLDEMARTLKRAGAARVVNWVVARTLPPA
jgi:predicted amidophosphoribosyltransferase